MTAEDLGRSLAEGPHDSVLCGYRAYISNTVPKQADDLRRQLAEAVYGVINEQLGASRLLLHGEDSSEGAGSLVVLPIIRGSVAFVQGCRSRIHGRQESG